ncbi:TolC family protein [Methylophaga sp. OBS1]|uniref:TolC family protein n=1 Tax=Methylophaga sp. OBS1 TaxID=2991933 RepID=UPI002251BF3F|nr:TolC family protein [Methylophaga sp. OBS1]MCX4191242.1 TolC family protein [Methylophaga sp. OBS1]MCX4191812.1 TolC family protein [Methylophaga sp. OBS1]
MKLLNLLCRSAMPVLAVVTGLLSSGSALAIEPSTAVKRTLQASPQLELYPYHVRTLEGEALQADLRPNPTLGASLENVMGTGDSRFLAGHELTLSLSQVLELGGKRERRVDVIDRKSAELQHDYEVKRLDVVAATLRDYYAALRLQHLMDWNRQRIVSEKAALEVIQKRANAGVVGEADLMRMQLRLAKSESKQQTLLAEHEQALRMLAANWVQAPDFEAVAGKLAKLPRLPDENELQAALVKTPDYLLLAAQARINQARLALAEAERTSNVTVGAGIRRFEGNDDLALVFNFSMPLQLNDQNQGSIAAAQARYQEKLAHQTLMKNRLEIALSRILAAMQNNIEQENRLNQDLKPVANSLLDEVERGYQLGIYNVLQWVDAQDELYAIERDIIEAQYAVHLQFLELERLSGMSLVNHSSSDAADKE